jgi:SAM-dependent methyltransferase
MHSDSQLKEVVKEKYGQIALQDKETNSSSCCGSGCCSSDVANIMNDEYTDLEGYNPDADLGLGCGLPTEFAKIEKGDIVVDLGSGAGNDAFIARHETGETGKVIGIDFTPSMIELAEKNNKIRGYNNVEFILGDIENIPLDKNSVDVVVSNCVLNLAPDKRQVFREIFRILKPGGHFSISDIVLVGELPVKIKSAAEMYAGCVSGAIQKEEYLHLIEDTGFMNVTIQKEKKIVIPDDVLKNYLSDEEINLFKMSGAGIYSVTVYAEGSCCGPFAISCHIKC